MPSVIIASIAELLLLLVRHTFLLPISLPRGEIDREISAGFLGKTDGRLTSASLIRRDGSPVA